MTASFTFDVTKPPTHDDMKPIYDVILNGTHKDKPIVSFGAVPRVDAEAWLKAGHANYVAGVGKRSSTLKAMDILDKIDLQGAT